MRPRTFASPVAAIAVAIGALLVAAPASAAAPRTHTSSTTHGAVAAPEDEDAVDAPSDEGDDGERGEEPGGPRQRRPRERGPKYRHERGSFAVSLMLGATKDDAGWRYAGGLGIGYAVITGVVPGVRGLLASVNGQIGGEYAATLTLTPPISLTAVPFLLGEVGRRHDPDDDAWMYGVGVGLYLGHPAESGSALQLGWMWQRVDWASGKTWDVQGPIISFVWDH